MDENGSNVNSAAEIAALQNAVAKCEQQMREVADMVTRVRHDLNNPLTGIIGQLQLLLREDLPPDLRRRIETVERLAARIRDTVAELRTVQRAPEISAAPEGEPAPREN